MRFALGHSFNLEDLFYNFPLKKLKLTCAECYELIGELHRNKLAKRIFRECFKLVIQDVIERNVTFWLPLTGNIKCNIHMKRVTGKEFQQLRRGGKWRNVDFIASNFAGYEIGLFMFGNRTPRVKTIFVSKELRDLIAKYTNDGKQYGDGVNDTKLTDYIDKIYALFPDISKSDVKRILIYGWKSLYLHNSYGGDVLIQANKTWFYIGKIYKNSLKHYWYYRNKLITKIRIIYKRKKIPWDGYYYFGLSDSMFIHYLQQMRLRGKKKKIFNFGPVFLYQILDECKLACSRYKYIFRTKTPTRIKYKYFVRDLNTNAELIEIRPPLKFKDVLVYNNEYDFI